MRNNRASPYKGSRAGGKMKKAPPGLLADLAEVEAELKASATSSRQKGTLVRSQYTEINGIALNARYFEDPIAVQVFPQDAKRGLMYVLCKLSLPAGFVVKHATTDGPVGFFPRFSPLYSLPWIKNQAEIDLGAAEQFFRDYQEDVEALFGEPIPLD